MRDGLLFEGNNQLHRNISMAEDSGVANKVERPQRWILNSRADLMLFVATPLLILPTFGIAGQVMSLQDVALYVAAFGALGHHLPGMMRAYGDRALFTRFRTRFLLAPQVLVLACVYSAKNGLTVLSLVAVIWGVWHGLMQTYGFARIYDAKVALRDRITPWLDFLMCVAWFGAGVILSPSRLFTLLDKYHVQCAGWLPPGLTVPMMQSAWMGLTVAVTVVFVGHVIWLALEGRGVNWIKLMLMAISFWFWWYTHVTVTDLLVGVALFEVFHDVQYLSIVWIFNRSRAEKDAEVGGFTRFLFRRSGALIGLYVGLVFAYGMLGLVAAGFSLDTINHSFQGALVASGLLHFYFDGFIWKVRDAQTRGNLGIAADGVKAVAPRRVPRWAAHGARWAAVMVPAVFLAMAQRSGAATQFERLEKLAGQAPDSADAQYRWGEALAERGRLPEAAEALRKAVELYPSRREAHNNLGVVLAQLGDYTEAVKHFQEALAIKRNDAEALTNWGQVLALQGKADAAAEKYQAALKADPGFELARENMAELRRGREPATKLRSAPGDVRDLNRRAEALADAGKLDEALQTLKEAVRIAPGDVDTLTNLGNVYAATGDTELARKQFEGAIAVDGGAINARFNLATLLAVGGQFAAAEGHLRAALAVAPEFVEARVTLGLVLRDLGKWDEAKAEFEESLRREPGNQTARSMLEQGPK